METTLLAGWWSVDYAMSLAGTALQASRGRILQSTVGTKASAQEVDHFVDYAVKILRDAEHWVERWHKSELTGLYLTSKGDRWLGTIKAMHEGKAIIAFVSAETLADTLITMAYALGHRSLKWRPDKRIVSK